MNTAYAILTVLKIIEQNRSHRKNIAILISHDDFLKSQLRFVNDNCGHTTSNARYFVLSMAYKYHSTAASVDGRIMPSHIMPENDSADVNQE